MQAIARSLRHSRSFQIVVLSLAFAACATAQDPDSNDGFINPPQAGTSSGGGASSGGVASTAGTTPVGTSGTTPVGTAGTTPVTGGQPGTGGTVATTAGTAAGGTPAAGGTSSCPQYTGTLAMDSVIFTMGFGTSKMGSWKGYGFTYTYGTATITPGKGNSCFAGAKFCANGNVPADDASGAGLGWNIGQMMGASTTTKVAITTPVKITFAGVSAGMRVQLSETSTLSYCYTLTATDVPTATIMPAAFKTECWGTTGTAYAGTPIESIQVVVPGAAAAAKPFDICVLDIEPG